MTISKNVLFENVNAANIWAFSYMKAGWIVSYRKEWLTDEKSDRWVYLVTARKEE